MKRIILYTIALFFTCLQVFAQNPRGIQYQIVVRAEDNTVLESQQVNLVAEVTQGSTDGSVIFSENHTVNTTNNGTAIFTIGSLENGIGSINDIVWGDNEYFLLVKLDSRILSTEKVLVVPFVKHVQIAYTLNDLNYNDLENRPESYFDGDYNSLTGDIPRNITQEESDKIDSLTVTEEINFQDLENKNIVSNSLVSIPEFGTTEGTMVEGHTAWKAVDGNLIHPGSVGINVPIPSEFCGAGIMVHGAILYDGIPVNPAPGMLFYDPAVNNGSFCYFNENGVIDTLDTGVLEGGGIKNNGYKLIADDFEINKSLVVGNGASVDRNAGDHTMVVASNIIRIKYDDTSNSSSFPRNDWQIITNDIEEGGDNYFAIVDATKGSVPFKIDAAAPDAAFHVADNGNVGIGTTAPAEKLEIQGNILGKFYIGDPSQLTGIDRSGTGLVENLGSTTIAADDNADDSGQIEFSVKNTDRLIIANNGDVGIGAVPTVKLEVNDTVAFENLIVEGTVISKSISFPVHKENITTSGFLFYDVTNKSVIILNPTTGNLTFYISTGAILGKEIVLINEHPTNKINSMGILVPGGGSFSLGQYESAKMLCTANGWVVTDIIQAL